MRAGQVNKMKDDIAGIDAITQIAGKRIRDAYFKKTQDGTINQFIIIFTDFSGYLLQFGQENTKMIFDKTITDNIINIMSNKSAKTISSGLFDPDGSENERVGKLFHSLWSKSGTYKYDKEEWKALGAVLYEAGYINT